MQWQVSWLTGHSLMRTFPEGPLRVASSGCSREGEPAHRAIRLQLQGQLRHWEQAPAPHSHLSPLRGTGAIIDSPDFSGQSSSH